jgi:hypothetical protein
MCYADKYKQIFMTDTCRRQLDIRHDFVNPERIDFAFYKPDSIAAFISVPRRKISQ